MIMRDRLLPILSCGLGLLLAGCGSGPLGLTTGALLGGGNSSEPPSAEAPSDPTARALQAAAVSARATKCGFYFDAAKLKAGFLAAEARQGATHEQLQKIEREYDYTRLAIAGKIAKDREYCSDQKTREIKADLARQLAGDFSPPPKKLAADDSWFGSYQAPTGREVLNPEWIKDPQWTDRTKRVEE
jgi:hypothetical protein